MRRLTTFALGTAAATGLLIAAAYAQARLAADPAKVEAAAKAAFPQAPADWASRLVPDQTMAACTEHRNQPPKAVMDAIVAREKAAVVYPPDGKLIGDWKSGERIAQSGYGMRFTDDAATSPNGGNCYACHQLDPKEVSYGTIGVSLKEYGKIRKFREADVKATYEKIYNSHVAFPCSLMPRFGSNGVLTVAQIKDLVALLMDPESPVNK